MALDIKKATDIKQAKGTYLIYGSPGIGKTSSIKYLPGKTLVLDVDRTSKVLKGSKDIDIAEIDNINTWDHWEEVLQDIVKNKNNYSQYDNIVVDNISELERCLLSDLGSKGKNKGVPSMGDYQYLQFRLVNSLRYMKNLDCNLIWIAWELTDLYTTAEGQYHSGFINAMAKAFQVPDGKQFKSVDELLNEFKGKAAKVRVDNRDYKGKNYAEVKQWYVSSFPLVNHQWKGADSPNTPGVQDFHPVSNDDIPF